MQPDVPIPTPVRRPRCWLVVLAVFLAALLSILLLAVPRVGPDLAPSIPLPSFDPASSTLLAVGDIGWCSGSQDEAVADLAAQLPGTIALLGDIVYPDGSAADFADCLEPVWGPLLARIRPAPGNHDYQTGAAAGYFSYFGALAGTPGEGWYSYELGDWHIVVLNSNCDAIGGCGTGSPQHAWLQADLQAHPAACTLAYWHHPRYSSGLHGDNAMTDSLWRALASAGSDLVLVGHDHDYERFAPIDGMRSFVVGTGGRSLYEMVRSPDPGSEVRANTSYGLLMLTLRDSSYDWRFVPAPGGALTDTGTGQCR